MDWKDSRCAAYTSSFKKNHSCRKVLNFAFSCLIMFHLQTACFLREIPVTPPWSFTVLLYTFFQCLVHWNPLPRRLVCLTTKPPFVNDLYMAGNVYIWQLSLKIYLIECEAKRSSFLDGGQVKIPITFTELSDKVSQDWSYIVNKRIPIPNCWTFFAVLLFELI